MKTSGSGSFYSPHGVQAENLSEDLNNIILISNPYLH